MSSSSTSAAASGEKLISVIPSKGMRYDASDFLVDKDADNAILAALKAALTNAAQLQADVDVTLAAMFTTAMNDPVLSALMKDSDGQEFLTRLQAQTTWASGMDDTVFASMFQSLVKAQKKWVEGAGTTFTFFKNDHSKTSTEIASFLKAVGDNKWGGLDAEIELLKIA
ncbi:hypothetical protein PG995_016341 [Apiospora arundinis]